MARFQLLVRELGKAPRVVPLTESVVVGRSRRADLVVDDDEVGREQFRIGEAAGLVFVEGIGQTNRTHVDGTALDAGQRVTIAPGATIKIGRTVIQVLAGQPAADQAGPAGELDATMIAGGPTKPPPDQERTGGFTPPSRATGQETAGGVGRPAPPVEEDFGQTMNVPRFRPGQAPPSSTPPSKAPASPSAVPPAAKAAAGPSSEDFGQTMNVPAFRPGPAAPSPQPPTVSPAPPGKAGPAAAADDGRTMQLGARPGVSPPPPTTQTPVRPQSASSPPPPTPPATGAKPVAAPGQASPASPSPASPPARPKTVVVTPQELAGADTRPVPMAAADIESRLHGAVPRLFVKGESIRRRVRLMKTKCRVGRAETADVLLPNESVSELHAELEFDGTQWIVRDCGSTNGTLVDGAVVRSTTQVIGRNSLLGFGNLRGLFLCNDAARAAEDRRLEQRALQHLVTVGLVSRDIARQVSEAVERDGTQTFAEILLGDTPLQPSDWVAAVVAARNKKRLWDRLCGWFRRRKPRA